MACVQKTSPSILALPGWDDASPSSAFSAGVTLQGSRAEDGESTGRRAEGGALPESRRGSTGWRAEGGALAGEQKGELWLESRRGSTGRRADIPDAYSLLTSPRANPRTGSFPLTQVQWPMGTNETVDAGAFEKLP